MQNLRRIRFLSEKLAPHERLELFSELSLAAENLVSTRMEEKDGFTVAYQAEQRIAFPIPLPTIKLEHIVCGYTEWLKNKYSLPGFVEVEEGDCVIDCGAFVGGFTLSAARIAKAIHSFEPDSLNFECLKQNASQFQNVTPVQKALHATSGKSILNISASAVEHSLLPPDDGTVVRKEEIETVSLADYFKQLGIESVHFLKLEAEGVEPEIFEGLGTHRPLKLAIDVSPEREGTSPDAYFVEVLAQKGYETRRRGNVLFARLDSKATT